MEHNDTLFEGNAQSFRIVSFVKPRISVPRKIGSWWVGLNLSRTTLRAMMKYPWSESEDMRLRVEGEPMRSEKFGCYAAPEDRDIYDWVWDGVAPAKTIAAKIMDASDDIAYATHDFEDGVWAGMIPLDDLLQDDPVARSYLAAKVLEQDRQREVRAFPSDSIDDALDTFLIDPLRSQGWAQRNFDRSKFSRRTT